MPEIARTSVFLHLHPWLGLLGWAREMTGVSWPLGRVLFPTGPSLPGTTPRAPVVTLFFFTHLILIVDLRSFPPPLAFQPPVTNNRITSSRRGAPALLPGPRWPPCWKSIALFLSPLPSSLLGGAPWPAPFSSRAPLCAILFVFVPFLP